MYCVDRGGHTVATVQCTVVRRTIVALLLSWCCGKIVQYYQLSVQYVQYDKRTHVYKLVKLELITIIDEAKRGE